MSIGDELLTANKTVDVLTSRLQRRDDEIQRLKDLLDQAVSVCEERADRLDDMGIECECCSATAKNCASDIEGLMQKEPEQWIA